MCLYISACPAGTYGENCALMCGTCVHGECDTVSGSCSCQSGWQGNNCEQGTICKCFKSTIVYINE